MGAALLKKRSDRMCKIKRIGNVGGGNTQSRSVYDPDGLSPTLCGNAHGNTIPYIVVLREEQEERCEIKEQKD